MAHERDEFSAFDEAGGPAEAPAEQDESKTESVPKPDYERAIQERNDAQKMRDEAIRSMLQGANPGQPDTKKAQSVQAAEPGSLDLEIPDGMDVDPETVNLLTSVLAAERRRTEERISSQYGPAMERIEREQSIQEIEGAVPGFKDELMADVERMFRELPPEQQQMYDNRIGIEALAARAKLRKLEAGNQQAAPDMAFSAPNRRSAPPTKSKGVSSADIWNLSEDDFDQLISRVRTNF